MVATSTAQIDPHSGTAITLYSLQAQADFIMGTNLPSMTIQFANIVNAAVREAFALNLGSDVLANDNTLPDPSFVADRSQLRTSRGGLGIRILNEYGAFLNVINNVIPQFSDKRDAEDNFTPGIFPTLTNVLGPGSFDQGNEATRWTAFMNSGEIGTEFRGQIENAKSKHREIINNLQHHQVPGSEHLTSIFDIPVEQFAAETKKLQRAIRDEHQTLMFLQLQHRAGKLPITDQRRIAFFANSTDVFANQLIGMPHCKVQFTPDEYITSIAMKLGLPIPALRQYVGDRIRNNANCQQIHVDPCGNNITTVAGARGGNVQQLHNAISGMITHSAAHAGIKCIGGDTDTSAKRIFSAATPAAIPISDTNKEQINSIVPDFVIMARHSRSATELAGSDHIADVKTLSQGLVYRRNTTIFADAVERREKEVNMDYQRTAKRLDLKLHNTPAGIPGPFQNVLNGYGNGGIVVGPVVGFFDEASPHMHQLRDLIANSQAQRYLEMYRSTNAQATGLHKQQLNRLWGHTFARGWARLILDRLRDLVCPQPIDYNRRGVPPNSNQNEEYLYFHPNIRGGVFGSR